MTIKYAATRYGFVCALVTLVLFQSTPPTVRSANTDKIKPEEIVAKHLASIGESDALKQISTRIFTGTTHFSFRAIQTGTADGNAVMASKGPSMLFGMAFASPTYPFERIGFDGKTLTVGYTSAGVRTTLGNFVLGYGEIFRDGLFGGILSSTWPFLNPADRGQQLEYAGSKKINGEETQVLRYMPKKGSDLAIRLYFDATTFRHVRTEYERTISATLGSTPDSSSQQRSTLYRLTEDFSDFKTESGLTLPHKYKVDLVIDGVAGNNRLNWETSFKTFQFNQPIPPESFNVEKGPA